jgi:hypothetical protein
MDLQHERQITIAIGSSRKATQWTNTVTALGDFYERFKTPLRGTETLTVYLAMKKAQQDELKDVGGFVGGSLSAPRRKAANVTGRDVVTLDFDNIPPYGTDRVKAATDALGCGAMIYSTRKHRAEAPRLRVVIPAGRTMTVEEHEAVARRLAEAIGIAWADPTTFEASRLMYWPSCSADGEYIYQVYDKPLLDVDLVLGTYADWHDTTSWPQVPGAVSLPKLAAKQGDPESKAGVVGAFCRVYDIFSAMEKYLPNIYEPVDNDPNRYTYMGGSTTGGKFLFSHHATDPCGGKLVNAFDLVRLHKFADADDEAAPGTPNNRLPSYTAMCELAVADSGVAALMAKERAAEAASDFEDVPATNEDDPANWMQKLRVNPQSGAVLATIDNICIILEHDPHLKNRMRLNVFSDSVEGVAPLPWGNHQKETGVFGWKDADDAGLYWFLEKVYNITKRGNIDAALQIHLASHTTDPVRDYLDGLTWDGTPRTAATQGR